MKNIYIRAARLIEADRVEFSCTAIDCATSFDACNTADPLWIKRPQRRLYNRVFNPFESEQDSDGYRWASIMPKRKKSAKELRVLLLCMMAACWKDFRENTHDVDRAGDEKRRIGGRL